MTWPANEQGMRIRLRAIAATRIIFIAPNCSLIKEAGLHGGPVMTRLMSEPTVPEILNSYNDRAPLAEASTIPAPWYDRPTASRARAQTVFSRTWQVVGRKGAGMVEASASGARSL